MTAEWYYAKNKQKVGPLTEAQLKELVRSGELTQNDMVWKQGMAKWMQASQVEGLFESSPEPAVGSSLPPPLPPPVPIAEWYYVKDGQRAGPVTDAQLKQLAASGAITRNDIVWKQGMATWTQAAQVEGLFPLASPPPASVSVPPALPAAAPQPAVAKKADSNEQKALAHLTKAQRLSDKGKFRPAIAEFTAATRLDPSLWKAFLGRGEAYYLEDEHEKAIADFTEAIRLNAECGEAYRERALVYLAQDNNVRAASDASKAVSLLSQDAQAVQYRGLAYMNLKHDDKALRDFSQSIALDSTVAATFRYRGHVYWLQTNNTQAIADLTKALELKPDYDIAAYFRGCAYFDAEMYREAIPDLERALRLPASNYHDVIVDATTRLTQARQMSGAVAPESGISDPSVAKHNATLDLMPYAAFLAQRPVTPVFINADCTLKHLSPLLWQSAGSFSGCSETHFCVAVGDLSRWKICMETAFVDKRSDAGKEIHGVLKDGQEHKVILQVAFQGPNGEPASEYEEFAILGTPTHPFTPHEVGISDPSVAKQVAQKKAAAQWHAVPVEEKSLSDLHGEEEHFMINGEEASIQDVTPERRVFSGDGPCPKCKTLIFVEWKNTYVTMKCPKCDYCFDLKEAIAFLSAYKPEDNYKPERAKALLAGQQQPPSSVVASATSPVKKRGPGIWHRLKSAMSPNTNRCPQCGENLAGEDEGTELIDREEGIQTRMKIDETYHSSGERSSTQRQVQVTVYHDTYWQYLKCKFCDHEWREKRETTYQP